MAISEIRTILLSDSSVTDLVGQQVYVGYAPQEVGYPFVLLEEIFQSPNDCKDAASTIDSYGFLVTVVSSSYPEVESVLAACKNVLNNYENSQFCRISFGGLSDAYDGVQDAFVKTHNYETLIRTT